MNVHDNRVVSFNNICDDLVHMLVSMIGMDKIIARYPVILSNDEIAHNECINWDEMSKYYPLDRSFVDRFSDKLNWILILERFIHENRRNYIISIPSEWHYILTLSRKYTDDEKIRNIVMSDAIFLEEPLIHIFNDVINWHVLLRDKRLSTKCIEQNIKYILSDRRSIVFLCMYQELSNEFVAKWASCLDWVTISKRSRKYSLSHEFIRTWIKYLNLDLIFKYQRLPEDIIDTYKNSIQSGRINIIRYQKHLSDEYILRNCKFYSMSAVLGRKNISLQFIYDLATIGCINMAKYVELIRTKFTVVESLGSCIILPISPVCEEKVVLFDQLGHGKALLLDNQHGKIRWL